MRSGRASRCSRRGRWTGSRIGSGHRIVAGRRVGPAHHGAMAKDRIVAPAVLAAEATVRAGRAAAIARASPRASRGSVEPSVELRRRAFIGEVGVVVLGVLLALGAQQVVQEIQMRADEKAFRQTIDHEIALNLFQYDVRARQFKCTSKKIKELRDWLDMARSGAPVRAIHPGTPATLSPYRSAWDNRDAEVFKQLPADVRQKYAEFYDELANNWDIIQDENQDWKRLWPYAEPGPISLQDRRIIRPTLSNLAMWNTTLEGNFAISRKIADELKVKALRPDNFPEDFLKWLGECRSAIGPPDKA